MWGGDCRFKDLQQVTRAETARQAEGPARAKPERPGLRTCREKGQAEARQVQPGPCPLPRDRLGWWSEEAFRSCPGQDEVRDEPGGTEGCLSTHRTTKDSDAWGCPSQRNSRFIRW